MLFCFSNKNLVSPHLLLIEAHDMETVCRFSDNLRRFFIEWREDEKGTLYGYFVVHVVDAGAIGCWCCGSLGP